MSNTINNRTSFDQYSTWLHNSNNLDSVTQKPIIAHNPVRTKTDSVTINYNREISISYESILTTLTDETQEQYNLLRELVTNMLKEQGIDFKIANGEQEIDINSVSQEEATDLIADNGYFGIEQTSNRIVDFAIIAADRDPSNLTAIKEGVEKGFNEALEAFGGTLPDISYDTYNTVMTKLDAWAKIETPEVAS